MTAYTFASSSFTLPIQPERRFSSGDSIWIVTDTFEYTSSYLSYSADQTWFRVGAVDLKTHRLGYFRFGLDGARAIVRAGLPPPPWSSPLSTGIALIRPAHSTGASGRFADRVSLIGMEPDLFALGVVARKEFGRDGHAPNSKPGMWQDLVDSYLLDKQIETVALAKVGEFSAGDVKDVVGKDVNVTPVLTRLVREKRLIRTGEKRGARYQVAPPVIPTRVDWSR